MAVMAVVTIMASLTVVPAVTPFATFATLAPLTPFPSLSGFTLVDDTFTEIGHGPTLEGRALPKPVFDLTVPAVSPPIVLRSRRAEQPRHGAISSTIFKTTRWLHSVPAGFLGQSP